jgi:hypothetical protein
MFFDNAENSKLNTRRRRLRRRHHDHHQYHPHPLLQGIGTLVSSDFMKKLLFKIFYRHCMFRLPIGL